MAVRNDGRIPGGPTTQTIIQDRVSHISSLVYEGEAYDYDYDEVKLRGHGDWRHGWELTPRQKELVQSFGFSHVDAIRFRRHDRDLLLSLIERWWPGRNTFQFPVGEMTITLEDVSLILGLPITGIPIYFDERPTVDDLIRTYLGVEKAPDQGSNYGIKLTWLRDNFMNVDQIDNTPVSVDEHRLICCTRAYLLSLCGGLLFPDGTGNRVSANLLPFFADLGTFTKHAWGAAVLANVYHSMTSFVTLRPGRGPHKNISGCITLIQLWSYEHFTIGRPHTYYGVNQRVIPAGVRWNSDDVFTAHDLYRMVSLYRHQFDTVTALEINWQPESVPQYLIDDARGNSMHRYYVIFHSHIMFHPADRVLRQFGMKQIVPLDPVPDDHSRGTIASRIRSLLPRWESRFVTYGVLDLSVPMTSEFDLYGSEDFVRWYGIPRMENRRLRYAEPRFQHRALDDTSLRVRNTQVNVMLENWEAASQDPNVDPRELLAGTAEFLSQPLNPPVLPLEIPEDQPIGHVRRRRAPPRRPRQRRTDRQAGEGTSQPGGLQYAAGEGTSQPGGLQYAAGEGTSQPGGPQYAAGEGTSQPGGPQYGAGEGTSQPGWDPYLQSDCSLFGTPQSYPSTTGGEGTSHPGWDPYMHSGCSSFGTPQPYPSSVAGEGTSQPGWDSFMQSAYSLFDTSQPYPSTTPIPTQEYEDYNFQPLPGETPEQTEARRLRLGLRPVPRRHYDRMARGE